MDSTKDSQTLIETLFSQITPESLPDLSQDRIDKFFEIIEEFNEIHQGNGKVEEVQDFELKIKELYDFSLKVKDIQEISLNFFDLLKLFAANIKEIETILQPQSQKGQESDTQSIIESLLSSLTPENFPQLTQEKVDDLFNIIEEVNEVYQGNQKTEEIMNFQDKIKELKEVLLITKSHEDIHRDYLNLLEIFANKIEEIKHFMEHKDEGNECHHLLKALKAQIQLVNFPYLLQEQIESFHALIQKLNKIISQPKLNNDEIPEVFNEVRDLWLQIRDHRETNQIFIETIALLDNKGASLKDIFKVDEPEVMIEKEKKIEEMSKKEKLKAVELAREKKNLLEYIENAPAAGLNCFYKYQPQLEALGINIPKLCVPNDLPKYQKFSVLKNLEEVKDERDDQEKIFKILIDILPELQSLGMLRLWKEKNPDAPVVKYCGDAIGLLLHVQTREQFIRSFLQQSLFKDPDHTFTESEVADIREAFSVHNLDSLNEDQNLSTIKDCWVKITSNELATKLANIIFEAAQMNSSLVHFIKDLGTYLQVRNDVKERFSTENNHKGFEEQKVSDFPVKAAEFTSKDDLLNSPYLPEKAQKETELIKGLLVVEDEETDYVMIEEKKPEEETDIILNREISKQVPSQISSQTHMETMALNSQSSEQKSPSPQEKPQASSRLTRDSHTPGKEGQETKFNQDLSHELKQDIKEPRESISDKIQRTDSRKSQGSPQKSKSEVGKELLKLDHTKTEEIIASNDDSHSTPFVNPVGSIQTASKESFENRDFRRRIEFKMQDFSARDEAGTKKLSSLDTIKVDNVNVMDSVLNSNLEETKDISTLLSENVFLHRFYALNSKNGMNGDRKRRLEEFYNATELISQEYSPKDLEVKEKVTELKRRIGLELQILFNLSTYILVALKLCKGFSWQNFKVSCLRYRQSGDEMCPENFAMEENLTRKEDNFSYGLFICTLPLSSWKNFKKNMRLALYMVPEHKLYMDTTLIPFDPLVDCHNKFVFNVKFNAPTSPAQGCDNLFETYIILSHFLGEPEYVPLRLDLLNQLETVPFSEETLTKILLQKTSKYLLNLITNEGFKTNRTHSLCLLGKMVSWKVLFQKETVLLNSVSIAYNTFDLFGLLDQLLILDGVIRQSLLSYLKCAIVVKMKMQALKNKAIIGYFARKISRIQTFDDDCFDFIVHVIEWIEFGANASNERADIVNPVTSAIEKSANIPNKTKLKYLIYLYDDMLRTDTYSTLLKINNALSRVDNEITNITPNPKVIRKIDQIFYKSAFWKTFSNNNIRRILYSFLSSTEIAPELRVTIEQSEIQKQFANYLESIFKTNNTEDVDFLRTVFIDCPNPDLAYYRAEEFISKYVSRGVIDRNCFLSKEASLHFMEHFFFPYYSTSQNPAKSMRENLKLWKSLGSLSREEALSFFDNLFQTAENLNNKTKRLEEISDQVCVAFFEHTGYFTMALDESGKAVEWKSNSLKESFFNTFFIKLENDNDKKNIKKIAVDKVVEIVLNHENISKDLRNSTLTRASLILADEITYEEIRNTIVKDPSSARLYGSFLRNMSKMSNEKTGSLIRKHLQTVVNDLYSYEITFDELDTIKSYDDQKKKLMFELLEDVNRNIKFDVFLNNLYKLADALQMKILQIDDFLDFFSDHDCIKAKKIKLSKLREALSGRKLSNMILVKGQYEVKAINLDEDFEKFSSIAVKTQSLLSFSFFNQFLAKDIQDEDELIRACEHAYTNMVNLFNRVVRELKDKTLNMALIKQYFFNLQPSRFDKEMEEISKHIHTDPANLGLLKKVLTYYLQSPDFIYISRSLIDFDNVVPLKSQSLTQSLSAYDELAQNLMSGESAKDVLASGFIEASENLVTELNNFNLKINKVDPINQIIHELSTGKDLCNFLDKVQRDNLNELKDFVNDQEESLISVKVIKELEYVWHFKANIIDKSDGLNDFVSRCSKMLHKNDWFDIQGYDEIQTCIKGCVTAKTSLERTYTEMVNRDASYKFRLMEIMDNSEIQIIHQDNNKKTVLVIPGNYSLKDLNEFKDKALLVITKTKNTNENNENIIDFDTIKKFTELVDALNVILNAYEELENFGFFQKFIQRTEKDSIVFRIRRNNFEEIERCKASVQKYTVQFSSHLLKLYDASYLFAHFYSRQLKTLHSTIMRIDKNWEEYAQNLALWANLDFNTLRDEISNVDVQSILNKDPLEQLTFMKDLLDRVGQRFYFNDDRIIGLEQPYVKLVEVKKENAFLGLLAGVQQIEMLDAQLNQILFCHYNTNPLEVTCFLQRAFLNGGRLPHFVLGIEDLSASLQNHFCEKMDSLLKNLHRFKSNVNLIVVGSTTTEKVYNYLYHNKEFKREVIKNVANEKQYFETLLKMAPNFEILVSKAAGMGKTHTILEQCKAKNLKPVYFPIAGNITPDRIGERLASIEVNQDTSLIIQIHNVADKKILDEILFQLIFFRSLKSNTHLFFPQHKFHLFIELQNLLTENYVVSIRSLSIFDVAMAITVINEVDCNKLEIDPMDVKSYFVMYYLKTMEDQKIAETDITYEGFAENFIQNKAEFRIDPQTYRSLLKKHFFEPLQSVNPSFIQLRFFIDIFYSALRTFGGSPFLMTESLHDAFRNFKLKEITKALRSDFVKILMENSRQFVRRTVSSEGFFTEKANEANKGVNFSEELRNFPLLIMRQGEKEDSDFCYSFVYNDITKVPLEIKKFVVAQELGDRVRYIWDDPAKINEEFSRNDLTTKSPAELLQILMAIAGRQKIKPDDNYAITLDNFYKMCLIIQRMRSRIPIIIMGETGVGKTALIRFLVENIYDDELLILNIHAGITEKDLIEKKVKIQERQAKLKGKRLWVFFDEFNTSEELGYISEVLSSKRFLGEKLDDNLIFLGACNPFRKREANKNVEKVGIEKNKKIPSGDLLYKVLPPPESLIEAMWDYKELREAETLEYIKTMLKIKYRIDKVIDVIYYTHNFIKENIEKSAVSLRDVDRFRRLYDWFAQTMPQKRAMSVFNRFEVYSNYNMERSERALILTLCFCYYMRLPTVTLRQKYVETVEKKLDFKPGHVLKVLENEQIDLLTRMELPPGTALNRALRENVFSTFVCLMNKIPIIIVGMPGCSKSLSFRLLCTNLRGQNSYEEYFRSLHELSIVYFQGSESVTSEGVEKVFERASRSLKLDKVIPTILFDEIGLAEVSIHNPLKVLHARLEGRPEISFIGLSNWELDAAKMGRFLVVARPLPDVVELHETAVKIFESVLGNGADAFNKRIQTLSNSYSEFIKAWRQKTVSLYPDFFGLRDFYSLIKYISNKIKMEEIAPENRTAVAKMLKRGIERNFDGQARSVNLFLEKVRQDFYDQELEEKDELDVLSLIQENLNDPDARCLLLIIRGEALIHMVSQSVNTEGKNVVTIHGSTFEQDKQNEQYNIRVLSEVINHVEKGNVIIFKDVNNSIQTSLYDLYNKAYHRSGGKNYCRVAVGANYNPKCFVHPHFNCIVYINEARLEDIDAPFLNRFEKHYLTLDRFLGEDELNLFNLIKQWMNKILGKYLGNNNSALKRDNFIINSSDEALASLCIKTLQSVRKPVQGAEGEVIQNNQEDDSVNRALRQCKEQLLANTTVDFRFLVETSPEIKNDKTEYEFIRQVYKAKYNTKISELCKQANSHLMIFTYDQDISRYITGDRVKTFKMVNMRCEKDIKDELDAYSQSQERLCVITLDYETEAVHLSLLLFLIDNMEKMNESECPKSFIIILHCSRIAVANSNEKPLRTISFLNGWSQVFLEELSYSAAEIEASPSIHPLITSDKINLRDLFLNTYQNCIKRFDIKFTSDLENTRSLTGFVKVLLEAIDDKLFQKIAIGYLDEKFKNEKNGNINVDWRREIINSKEFANLAWNVSEASRLYATKKAEEYCAMMMNYLLTNDIFVSLFPSYGVKLLENYIPDIKPMLQRVEFNPEFTMRLISKVFFGSNQQKVRNLVEVFLEYPRLFPCSKIDQARFFDLTNAKEDSKNLYSIATAINDMESRVVLNELDKESNQEEEKNQDDNKHENKLEIEEGKREDMSEIHPIDNEDEIQFKAWNTKFKDVLETMTCLTRVEDGVCTFNMYAELESPENQAMKELYLLDMRNEFIEKIAKTSLNGSMLLDKLIRQFLNQEFTVADYLLVLFRGGALWINLLQIYNVLSSLETKDNFIEELFLPNINIEVGFDLGVMLNAQMDYTEAFFGKCAELFAPQKKNIQRMGDSKSYTTVFVNIYFWLIKLQIEFSKYGLTMPITLNIWKNFVELIESISKGNSEEIYNKLDERFVNNVDANLFMNIDNILQDLKNTCSEEEKAQISKFQATTLFKLWVANRHEINEDKELATRLLVRINHDKYFPNFCSNILVQLINTDNQAQIYENLDELEDDVLIGFNECFGPIGRATYDDPLSTILTDFFDKYIEDPEIAAIREEESEASELLNANFEKFTEYWALIENQQQKNHIQLLYIMAFFKHYMRAYAECLIEDVKYKILQEIDNYLKRNNFLADSLSIFTLKILRIKLGSYKRLERFLYEVRKMQWIEKFEQSFKEIPDRLLMIPPILNASQDQRNVQAKWTELINSDFSNEGLFTQLITLAGKDHNTRYLLLNLFLTNAYVGSLSQPKINAFKQLMQKHDALLKQHLNEYQIALLKCYIDSKVDQEYLKMEPDLDADETNAHIIVLNVINWMVSLNNVVSPLTSLFFTNGKIAENFSTHFQSMFVVSGLDNPFIECAQRAKEACRFRGVYICSAACPYIYTVEGCGWTNETKFCPFCCENIGNAQGRGGHTLARVDKGARRLGPVLQDTGRYYAGNAEFQKDQNYWSNLEGDIDKEMDKMREQKMVKVNQGRIDQPQFVNLAMTGYNRMTEKVRDELQTPTLGRIKRCTDHFLRFVLHSSLYVMIALKWISPQEALKIVPAQDLNRLLSYLKDIIQDCLKKLREYLDCNDSLVWIIAMEQFMAVTIQTHHNANFTANTCKNRDRFERVIEQVLDNHLGESKATTIKLYRQTSQVIVQKLDSILQEEELSNDYRFLQILRLVKLPSLDNMVNDYMDIIKTRYPILDECVKNAEQMETVSKLVNIVRFSNELMKLMDFQITRKDAEDTAISDLIERLPKEKVGQMTKLLEGFLESWNSLNLGPIQVECKTVGTTDKYTRKSPVIAFLVDSMQGKNQFGKILSGVIYNLGAQQNEILNQISGRAKNMKQLQNIKLLEDKEVIPQSCGPQDILDLNQDVLEAMVFVCSSNNYTYGNGVASYDFEAIQFNLMLKIMGKKLLLQKLDFYPNVKFIGEVFTSKSKFSSHIIDIRNLGLTHPIPNLEELEDKFKLIQERSKNQFYSVLKQVLGSLERIMIFYKTLTKKGVTISEYVREFKFNAISPLLVDEEPIRSYQISVIVSLYEAIEKISTPFTWKIIPNIFKSVELTDNDKKDLDKLFREMQDEKQEAKIMLSLQDLGTAISRFAARCLVLDDENEPQFKPTSELMPMMKEKEDIWPYPCDEESIENLTNKFPDITFNKIFSLNEFIQNRLNPHREGPNPRIEVKENKEIIPEKPVHKKKGAKAKITIYN